MGKTSAAFKSQFVETLEPRWLLAANVVINEIHYDPPDKTQAAEYAELFNDSDKAVDLSGWSFRDGIDFQFPAGTTIDANGFLVVAQDPATIASMSNVDAFGPWSGQT